MDKEITDLKTIDCPDCWTWRYLCRREIARDAIERVLELLDDFQLNTAATYEMATAETIKLRIKKEFGVK